MSLIYGNLAEEAFCGLPPIQSAPSNSGKHQAGEQLFEFALANLDHLLKPGHALGTWFYDYGLVHVIDVVVCLSDRDEALDVAKRSRQLAIFDLQFRREIPVRRPSEIPSSSCAGGVNARARLIDEEVVEVDARDKYILWIGSDAVLDGQMAGFQKRRSPRPASTPHMHLLPNYYPNAAAVFVYEIEVPERFQQLKNCCEHQRRFGGIQFIFDLSHRLQFDDVPKRVIDAGAQFLPCLLPHD